MVLNRSGVAGSTESLYLLLALAVLIARPPRLYAPRPKHALRGCVAMVLLTAALGLGGLALLVAQ